MASEAILKQKQEVIDEVKDRVNGANTIVLFDYRGLTDSESKELRIKLRETNSDYKVYKLFFVFFLSLFEKEHQNTILFGVLCRNIVLFHSNPLQILFHKPHKF